MRKAWIGLANRSRTVSQPVLHRKHHIAKQQHAVERTRELFAKVWAIANRKPRAIMLLHSIPDEPAYRCWRICRISSCDDPDDKHWPEEHWRELIGLLAD